MAFIDVAALANDATFTAKVKAAMVSLALSLGGDPTKNDERTSLATQVLRAPDSLLNAVVFASAVQANGVAPATDAAVTSLVTTVLQAMARR